MDQPHTAQNGDALESTFSGFYNLMPFRIQEVLLVSSLYESFILEEDGLVTELISSEYRELNLSYPPRATRVPRCQDALEAIEQRNFDLIVTMTRFGEWDVTKFAEEVRKVKPDLPIVVLASEHGELTRHPDIKLHPAIDRVFVWNGDARILPAIFKIIEDQRNAEHDTTTGNVRVIILVENSVQFYSSYLPTIYTELMNLTRSLMAEGINRTHRLLRQRARPKVLLAETFEEAWDLYTRFKSNLLGVISDVRFPRADQLDSEAGLEFIRRVKSDSPHMPALLQSSDKSHRATADALGADFLHKKSLRLFESLRNFICNKLGFGDFVFCMPDGREVSRAADLRSFAEQVVKVPDESLAFHARQNHFSNWLMARTEFDLALRIRPRKVSDFDTIAEMREYLLKTLEEFQRRNQTGVITEFSRRTYEETIPFARIGGGSMGGKGRGLAFISSLIRYHNLYDRFDNVRIAVPRSVAIGTAVFDRFIKKNRLYDLVARDTDDQTIVRAFLKGWLPNSIRADLGVFLDHVRYPLAVRSSSLLEDSLDQPFAGVYQTHMIPNNHPDPSVRLDQLCAAIKLVYASTYLRSARRYMESTSHRVEEERMGVILQELVGSRHGDLFYPTFSGVARSYNYYPLSPMESEDGVASVALGLGKIVVEGGNTLMFSPAHPRILPSFGNAEQMLAGSQKQFYALDLSHPKAFPKADGSAHLLDLGLEDAEADGTLSYVGSIYSPENDAIYDGIHRPGPRLISFAHVLKSDLFPLADVLKLLLELGRQGIGSAAEIEFAVNMDSRPMEFGFLQIRPIVCGGEQDEVAVQESDAENAFCFSSMVMGNGLIRDVRDIIYVIPDRFNASKTVEIAAEMGRINGKLVKAGRGCVIIGPGRWGTADRWLGIPVTWEQICSARVLVETALNDFVVTPSQGTHFFQNLTTARIGYFAVGPTVGEGFVSWDWLAQQPPTEETNFLRHVCLSDPIEIKLDGHTHRGAMLKPARLRAGKAP